MGQVECDYRVAKIWEIFPSQINLGRGGNEARSQRILDEIASKFQQRWFIIKYTQNPPPLIRLAGLDCFLVLTRKKSEKSDSSKSFDLTRENTCPG